MRLRGRCANVSQHRSDSLIRFLRQFLPLRLNDRIAERAFDLFKSDAQDLRWLDHLCLSKRVRMRPIARANRTQILRMMSHIFAAWPRPCERVNPPSAPWRNRWTGSNLSEVFPRFVSPL